MNEKELKSYAVTLVSGSHNLLTAAEYKEDDNWLVFTDLDGRETFAIVKAYVMSVETAHDGGAAAKTAMAVAGEGLAVGRLDPRPSWMDSRGYGTYDNG